MHTLNSGRYLVGINVLTGVCTRNPPKRDPPNRHRKIVPLERPMVASSFEALAELGAPTYANPNAAIKAARRVYQEIRDRFPWRACRGGVM